VRARYLLAAAVCTATLTFAPAAGANVMCVHQAGQTCPAGSIDEGSDFQGALDAAGSDGQATTVDVLAGTYPGGELSLSSEPLEIAGAGASKTILSGGSPGLVLGCPSGCGAGTFAVHDLGIQLTDPGASALGLSGSFDGHDIAVTATPAATGALTGVALAGSATLERATVSLPFNGAPTTAISAIGADRASDVNLTADIGATVAASGGLNVTRATIAADVAGVQSKSPGANVTSSVIRLSGTGAAAGTAIAQGLTPSIGLVNSTVIASGSGDVALNLQSEGLGNGDHQAVGSVTNSILWGLSGVGSCTTGFEGTPPALTETYDDVDPLTGPTGPPACNVTSGHLLSVTPGYVSGTDLHLRHDSPLVDQGDPSVATPAGTTDLGGQARLADGDGNGSLIRDIGAYEYQRLPPVARTVAPTTATLGQLLTFDATASYDPDDGESVTAYRWDFGDGTTAATAVATHAFSGSGAHVVTLRLTDPIGLTSTTPLTVTVPSPASPPGGGSGGGSTTPGGGTTTTTKPAPGTGSTPSHPAAAKLTLSVGKVSLARLKRGLHVTATLTGASGRVTITLRQATRTLLTKRVTFTRAGRKTVVLKLSKRHPARTGKLTLTAKLGGSRPATVRRTVLVRA
jgi:PKD domain